MMSTEIVVALVAAGAVGLQVLSTFLIRQREANDSRTNLDRDISILRRLNPEADEAKRLERHIAERIEQMVSREERQREMAPRLWFSAILMAMLLAVYGLSYVRPDSERPDFRSLIDSAYWFLWVMVLLFLARMAFDIVRFLFQVLRTGWQIVDLSVRNAKLRRVKNELWRRLDALTARDVETMNELGAHKDQIITKFGQQVWDDLMSRRAEVSATIEELRRERNEDAARSGKMDD